MNQSKDNRDNVVDFGQRRRMKRAGASGPKQGGKSSPSKFWLAVQLAVFLALVAYMMQTCR